MCKIHVTMHLYASYVRVDKCTISRTRDLNAEAASDRQYAEMLELPCVEWLCVRRG